MLEFAAFLYLRFKHPELPRPFRVPLPNWGLVIMLIPPSALISYMLIMPIINRDLALLLVCGIFVVIGLILYPFFRYARKKEWMSFYDNLDVVLTKDLERSNYAIDNSKHDPQVINASSEQATLLRRNGNSSSDNSVYTNGLNRTVIN
eukprot:TRINITY_DN38501_c0_g1_i1.p2 TRINITY_DN38501_c0_g1~~TRINITY_DN38501_c0_g1_i1.p2  ORF type:complete len:168 (+),score=2.09 TRINITY_DN38501_c0_g1_i1:63-506(+)